MDLNVTISVQCRPLSSREVSRGCKTIIAMIDKTVAVSHSADTTQPPKEFIFDHCYYMGIPCAPPRNGGRPGHGAAMCFDVSTKPPRQRILPADLLWSNIVCVWDGEWYGIDCTSFVRADDPEEVRTMTSSRCRGEFRLVCPLGLSSMSSSRSVDSFSMSLTNTGGLMPPTLWLG